MFENYNRSFGSFQNSPVQSPLPVYPSDASTLVQQQESYASPRGPMQAIPAGTVNPAPQLVIQAADLHSYLMMQAELMRTCWENGAAVQRTLDARKSTSAVSETMNTSAKSDGICVGVYDRFGYGVFRNEASMKERMTKYARYWDRNSMRYQSFSSYPEALTFTKEGAARLTGRREDALPNPRYQYDWKENVR